MVKQAFNALKVKSESNYESVFNTTCLVEGYPREMPIAKGMPCQVSGLESETSFRFSFSLDGRSPFAV